MIPNELKQANITDKHIISFDVMSLLTHIPLKETVDLAVNLLQKKDLKMNKKELRELLFLFDVQNYFLLKGTKLMGSDGSTFTSYFRELIHGTTWRLAGPSFYRTYISSVSALGKYLFYTI